MSIFKQFIQARKKTRLPAGLPAAQANHVKETQTKPTTWQDIENLHTRLEKENVSINSKQLNAYMQSIRT